MPDAATFPDLGGRRVFITGGGSGIGASLTEGFTAHGAKVAFVDIDTDASTALCDGIAERHGTRPLFLDTDIRDIPALKAAIAEAAGTLGTIQVLVNNAANDTRHAWDEYGPDEWDNAMAINLRPHFFTAQTVAPMMKADGGGAIVNFSSISYVLGQSIYPAYTTAKAGIVSLTRALARALGPDNIRVNAILPGWVMTERQLKLWVDDDARKLIMDNQCLKSFLRPEDIVPPTLFLASDAARMVTGQTLTVDGGWT
ncbi:MAG: SDR family oxidoreductase [Rhodobiaceae bacterium]|nr:SDR family oxidoreductase [Rhodobiaceae bacterium]